MSTPPAAPPFAGATLARLAPQALHGGALVDLSTDEVRPGERLDYWREMVLRLFADVEITATVDEGFCGRMQSRCAGGIRTTVVQATTQAVARRHREAREQYEDCYFAVLMLSGQQWMEQDGRSTRLEPGHFALYDASRPHRLSFSRQWGEIILNIPRRLLDHQLADARHRTAVALPCHDGLGAVLAGFLGNLVREMPRIDAAGQARLAGHAVGLVAAALDGLGSRDGPQPASRAQTLARAKALIDRQLHDPALDSDRIAGALRLSPRYLNKLFNEEQTSLMRHVWQLRLARCQADLADPAQAEHSISDIALRWGFNDLSHFSRAFRERTGLSPRDWRSQHRRNP